MDNHFKLNSARTESSFNAKEKEIDFFWLPSTLLRPDRTDSISPSDSTVSHDKQSDRAWVTAQQSDYLSTREKLIIRSCVFLYSLLR